jgi:heptosyltransferase-2
MLKNEKIMIAGGPQEIELQKKIIEKANKKDIQLLTNTCNNTLKEFIEIVNKAKLVVTGDTMALHLATALKKPVVALFFCTPDWELEDYGIIKKLTSPLLEKYWYTDEYSEELVNSISAEEIYNKIKEFK